MELYKEKNQEEGKKRASGVEIDRDMMRIELLKKKAEEYGISAEGKEPEEFLDELRRAMVYKKAAELGIETEGKEVDEILREMQKWAISQDKEK